VRPVPGSAVHPAARAFGAVADRYERGRPGYPPDAVARVVAELGIGPGRRVLDLAAGTGKLTELLVPTGASVVAVEPSAGMRTVLARRCPGVVVLEGTATDLPLPASSVDAVVVAQAFHWFAGPDALAEMYRVLRPGGGLGLVWNRRDPDQRWAAELDELMERHRGDTPGHGDGMWRAAFDAGAGFTPLSSAAFPMAQPLDADGLVDRVLSVSYNAALGGEDRRRLEADARALAAGAGGSLTVGYLTEVHWCRAEPAGDGPGGQLTTRGSTEATR